LLNTSSDLPGLRGENPAYVVPIWSCFWRGLHCRRLLPAPRCALTAPFHPYLKRSRPYGLLSKGGLLSAALSVALR